MKREIRKSAPHNIICLLRFAHTAAEGKALQLFIAVLSLKPLLDPVKVLTGKIKDVAA